MGAFAARGARPVWRTLHEVTGRLTTTLLAILFAFAAAPGAASAETAAGAVYVTTLPAGADIWLDGTYVGRAPVLVDALPPGRHSLTLTLSGWVVQEVEVTVPSGGVVMSGTRLVPAAHAFDAGAGSVVVREAAPGAKLLLDGAPWNPAPSRTVSLPAGPHHVAVVTPQGRTTRAFTVLPGMTTSLVLRTEPSSAEARSAVVAPADDYVGADAYTVEGSKIVVRTSGHLVVAHFGDTSVRYDGATISFDSAPTSIGGKLYLPLALLQKLSDDMSKSTK
jgi:hypothetical protein